MTDTDYQRVGSALEYIGSHVTDQPDLDAVAEHVHLSPYHFQRLFKRWVGISPKRFLQYLTINHAKQTLAESRSVLEATYDAGLSSPSRLHDLFVTLDAVTPGEFGSRGEGVTIRYGRHESPFGDCMLSITERGICGLSFHDEREDRDGLADVRRRWPRAEIKLDLAATQPVFDQLLRDPGDPSRQRLTLLVNGTNFQVKVWEALLRLPAGYLVTYSDIARFIDRPKAVRAVGAAVGSNPIAWLIPCHRVINSMGVIGAYRWGAARKRAMIGWEAANRHAEPPA